MSWSRLGALLILLSGAPGAYASSEGEHLEYVTPSCYIETSKSTRHFVEWHDLNYGFKREDATVGERSLGRAYWVTCYGYGPIEYCKPMGPLKEGSMQPCSYDVGPLEVPGTEAVLGSVTVVTHGIQAALGYDICTSADEANPCGYVEENYFERVPRYRRKGLTLGEEIGNAGGPGCANADPVQCANGNFTEKQTDLSISGRGLPLHLTRTYNSLMAVRGESAGPFGNGWAASYFDHLEIDRVQGSVKVVLDGGGTVVFRGVIANGRKLQAHAWSQDKLAITNNGEYVLTLPSQERYYFSEGGQLLAEEDRYGNRTSMGYSKGGTLLTVTDASGRTLKFSYNASEQVRSITDPMGRTVSYGYEDGNLTTVTEPGESSPRWRFVYQGKKMTEMIDGRGGATMNSYNELGQVIRQEGPMHHETTFEYATTAGEAPFEGVTHSYEETAEEEILPEPTRGEEEAISIYGKPEWHPPIPPEYSTTITHHDTGEVTVEHFNSEDQLTLIIHGYGTNLATTETLEYNLEGQPVEVTRGNHQVTKYEYDSEGNRVMESGPLGKSTLWGYDSEHDLTSTTTPSGEKTTIKRNASNGAAEAVLRPAPDGQIQETTYVYGAHGEVIAMTDPAGKTWSYGYDSYGDRTRETAPEGQERTFGFNLDSEEIWTISPAGNAAGAEASKYQSTIERDDQGRVVRVIEPAE